MTSPHDPSHHDDDTVDERDLLASRALDGDVERDDLPAEILARVEDMDRVRAWMVDIPPVAASVTDSAVAAARAAARVSSDDRPVAPVVPLTRRRLAPALPWLGAVAAAAALVVGVTAMNGGDDSIDVADKQDASTMEATADSVGIEQRTSSDTMAFAEGDVELSASLPDDGGSVGGESAPAETVEPAQAPAEDNADPQVSITEAPSPGTDAPSTGDVPVIADLAEIPRSEASLTTGALCAPDDALIVPAALLGTDVATAALVEVVIDTDGDLVAYSLGDCVEVERLPTD